MLVSTLVKCFSVTQICHYAVVDVKDFKCNSFPCAVLKVKELEQLVK